LSHRPLVLVACLAPVVLGACQRGNSSGNDLDAMPPLDAFAHDAQLHDAAHVDAAPLDAHMPPPDALFSLPDSSADAFVHPPVGFGPAMVLDSLLMSEQGHVLNPFAGQLNSSLESAVADGSLRILIEFIDLDTPVGVINDPDVTLVIYQGADADGNSANDFTGSGEFLVDLTSATVVAPVAIVNGQIDVPAGTFEYLSVNVSGLGEILVVLPEMQLTLLPNLGGISAGHITGAIPSRSLDLLPNVTTIGNPAGSLLDLLVTSVFELQPDVDVDGDGQLETYFDEVPGTQLWDELVSYCVDLYGDLTDEDCAQHPWIWDGYSVAFDLTAVPAKIVGSLP
jgi:hypothetical protein